jgi:hypothetical protein
MPRGKKKSTDEGRLEGLIEPRPGQALKSIWRAFREGGTWNRQGKGSTKVRARYRHVRYEGRIRLEWWGKAIHFTVHDPKGDGLILGAFTGHVCRHGAGTLGKLELRPVGSVPSTRQAR